MFYYDDESKETCYVPDDNDKELSLEEKKRMIKEYKNLFEESTEVDE